MENTSSFRLTDGLSVGAFEAKLVKVRSFIKEVSSVQRWRFFDTFDWRLYEDNLTLRLSAGELTLTSAGHHPPIQCTIDPESPFFVSDLPTGRLQERLASITNLRALIELTQITIVENHYRILNSDEKTVAHMTHIALDQKLDNDQAAAAQYATLRPVRGYDGHARRLAKTLNLGTKVLFLEKSILQDALQSSGRVPLDYSAKLDFRLSPEQRADEATKVIHRRLLETIRANESGIIEDIDVEFLHDYRVAIRRTRSALSQIPGVFPEDKTTYYRKTFRSLGKRTNLLRDLDVYLLAEPKYRSMLPKGIQEDITPLFSMLYANRQEALQAVQAGLCTSAYKRILADWDTFLGEPGVDDKRAPNAGVPIIVIAKKRIDKRYRRIVKDGTYILDHTEDELLHALRLECKKLRYLLEFFSSLFPRKKITRLINQLKGLQENLGDFTDLAVQQEALMSMADQLPNDDPRTRRASIATGALVETLARRQQAVKTDFAATFTQFAEPKNQRAFAELFGSTKGVKKGKQKGQSS